MKYVETYLPTLKTHVVNLKRDAKDLSRDLQRLEVCGKLVSKLSNAKKQNTLFIIVLFPVQKLECLLLSYFLYCCCIK